MKLSKIFGKENNIIIGVIHLPPLLGYKDFPGFERALENALADLAAFENAGVDGIIFENNYDIPHKICVDSSVASSMTFLGEKLRKATRLPLGVSVLWNDYQTALSIAKILDLQFVRIPVFVDTVQTNYGIVRSEAKQITKFKKMIEGSSIALFTDIHVKHAQLLSKHDLITSARLAIANESDALIVTGQWTGDAPLVNEVENIRKQIGTFPILIGSGIERNNVKSLFQFANGGIVSTSLKDGLQRSDEVNIKAYSQRINKHKVQNLLKSLR